MLKQNLKFLLKEHIRIYKFLRKGKFIVKGQDNTIRNHAYSLKGCVFRICGNRNLIEIAEGVNFKNVQIDIHGDGHVLIIHKDVRIREGGRIRIDDMRNKLEIGQDTSIVNVYFSLQDNDTSIIIGERCLFSTKITFRTSDSHSVIDCSSGKRINPGKNIEVGNHVWIGNGVTILKGVIIGNNSIIGTCSLVTKNIGDNCLAVGIPAKVVKTGINWDKKRI